LSLQQAACELNLSISTVRRMLRDGRLRNRIVPRRGGFAYLVYAPGNRHSSPDGLHACAHGEREQRAAAAVNGHNTNGHVSIPRDYARRTADDDRTRVEREAEIHRLEQQVESLSHALSRALRVKQVSLPPGLGAAGANPDDPYGRYRWLVRRKRWWPF
jgi:hypothetical protein